MKRIKFLCFYFILISTPLTAEDNTLGQQAEENFPVISDIKANINLQNQSLEKLENKFAESVIDEEASEVTGNDSLAIPVRDPFNSSYKLGLHPYSGQEHGRMGTTFLPDAAQTNLPDIRLKGIVSLGASDKDELLALLEVNRKEVYMVKVGDEVSYDPGKPASAIKIKTISRLSVTVEVGSLGNTLVIR